MGVPPMSLTGILPVIVVSFCLFLSWQKSNDNKDTGGTTVRLMGKMPMLRMKKQPKNWRQNE
jgi:hypothetical protein